MRSTGQVSARSTACGFPANVSAADSESSAHVRSGDSTFTILPATGSPDEREELWVGTQRCSLAVGIIGRNRGPHPGRPRPSHPPALHQWLHEDANGCADTEHVQLEHHVVLRNTRDGWLTSGASAFLGGSPPSFATLFVVRIAHSAGTGEDDHCVCRRVRFVPAGTRFYHTRLMP